VVYEVADVLLTPPWVEVLLEYGAEVDDRDEEGVPLMVLEELEVTEVLLLSVIVAELDDEMLVLDDEEVLELEDEEEVEEAPHSPVIDGTASGPFPMATKLVPQSTALARRRFWLS
jgi:hypothetical protein